MKEITITLYEYDELSEEAQKRAYDDWTPYDFPWTGEVRDTLEKLEDELGITVDSWTYDACYYRIGQIRFDRYSDSQLSLSGRRAQAFLWNRFGHLVLQRRKLSVRGNSGRTRESKVLFDRTYTGTCPLTGWYFDNNALDPLSYFCLGMKWDADAERHIMIPHGERRRWNETTVEDVLRDCVNSLFECVVDDVRYCESMPYFRELCMCNEWLFKENGKRYKET